MRSLWKPGVRRQLPSPTLPSMPRSFRQGPLHGSYTAVNPYQILIMDSVSGVQHVDTIQRVLGGRKIVPDNTKGRRSAPWCFPGIRGVDARKSDYVPSTVQTS
jgi:hypothetical protein